MRTSLVFDAEVHATLLYNSFTPSAKRGQSEKPINFPLAAAMFLSSQKPHTVSENEATTV